MDILLLAVTVISLGVALVMSAAAWRLSREERVRSNARVAALAAAAAAPAAAPGVAVGQAARHDSPESTIRMAPKPVAEPEAEPVAVGESRTAPWSTARVSTFSTPKSVLAPKPHDVVMRDTPAGEVLVREAPAPATATAGLGDSFLGSSVTPPPSSGRQRGLAVAAAVLFVVIAGGGYWTIFAKPGAAGAASPAAASESAPLELVSLRHERRGGRLAVTGLVRNPGAGTAVDKLGAVVFLFDQQGAFITSARADVDFTRLAPGDESPFVVNVDAPATVARYRVSFRTNSGVVPHIDRRGQEPVAASIGS
jgi:hypothetical protein